MPPSTPTLPPIMCLTWDGVPLPAEEQTSLLLEAGATWIQLRMKGAPLDRWLDAATTCVKLCHERGALLVVNDSVEVAERSGADGVHLGKADGDWARARERLGPASIIGGTVTDLAAAREAVASRSLSYVGVGPFRFTSTKAKLAPVLGLDGIAAVRAAVSPLPAWAIGGLEPADLPQLRRAGLSGVAVSSGLFRSLRIDAQFKAYSDAWQGTTSPLLS